ncbi:type II secretion system minor pseudopilin GspJ [Niveibacterium terrae]|uniref:type II secretion system minor pseudopilin GspJ n=1 Tax=Niveibacterium terrae TaxID=3373598 RepID=UPI003A92007D
MRDSRRLRGMTLIEVMVAIAIFALLGVISWRALSGMADARERMNVEFARWRAIARFGQMVENDLAQIAPRMGTSTSTQGALVLSRSDTVEELRLTRFDAASGGLQRRAYRLDKEDLLLERIPLLNDSIEPEKDVLLTGVKSLHWRFLVNGKEVTEWTPSTSAPWVLPGAVIMEMELADVGTVTRVFALH